MGCDHETGARREDEGGVGAICDSEVTEWFTKPERNDCVFEIYFSGLLRRIRGHRMLGGGSGRRKGVSEREPVEGPQWKAPPVVWRMVPNEGLST